MATTGSSGKYYSPYSDISTWNTWHNMTEISQDFGIKNFTLGFIQQRESSTTPEISWAGFNATFSNDAQNPGNPGLLTQQVRALETAGSTITVSFGGEHGTDPASFMADYYNRPAMNSANFNTAVTMLAQGYQQVINVLGVDHLDFDIEGAAAVGNISAAHIRNYAIVQLQRDNPNLHISFTLPSSVEAGDEGISVNSSYHGRVEDLLVYAKQDGVKIDVVNIMAMAFGSDGGDEFAKIKTAAIAAHQDVIDTGVTDSSGMSSKLAITPWLGVNNPTEKFTI